MRSRFVQSTLVVAFAILMVGCAKTAHDPLPNWNEGPSKKAIISFVEKVTKEGSPDYVAPGERIAVFDNDGTLWCEQPMYFQLAFAIDRLRALAPQHPEWQNNETFKAVLAGDMRALGNEKAIIEVLAVSHAGMTTDDYNATVKEWLKTAKHPKFDRLYGDLIYQPMLEVLAYLRANGFKTFIVSGGGVEFMRNFAEKSYGIPSDQVVGSFAAVKFEMIGGKPTLIKEAKIEFIDDGPGKPVGINHFIGRRPVMAFGNSDGDLQMLQYTTGGPGARFGALVHHTDGVREVAYDRNSHIGKLDAALTEAGSNGWTVINMKDEWKTIFPAKK